MKVGDQRIHRPEAEPRVDEQIGGSTKGPYALERAAAAVRYFTGRCPQRGRLEDADSGGADRDDPLSSKPGFVDLASHLRRQRAPLCVDAMLCYQLGLHGAKGVQTDVERDKCDAHALAT